MALMRSPCVLLILLLACCFLSVHSRSVDTTFFLSLPAAQQRIREQYLAPAFLNSPALSLPQLSAAPCPCSNTSLCSPVKAADRPEIFIFQVSTAHWHQYDWTRLTTIVAADELDPALLCYAHERSVRVVSITNYPLSQMGNASYSKEWVNRTVSSVTNSFLDGTNVDFEDPLDAQQAPHYTALLQSLNAAVHAVVPTGQVSVDLAWSPSCIDNRCYDSVGIAAAVDLVFIMSYDLRSQVWDLSDCVASANSPIRRVIAGVLNYTALGIPTANMVLGVPWYAYSYPCLNGTEPEAERCEIEHVPFQGAPCSDAAGTEIDFVIAMALLRDRTTTGPRWNEQYGSWWFNYVDDSTGRVHQVWFDDVTSLTLKYQFARAAGLRGVGMWTADFLDYSSPLPQQTMDMWHALQIALPPQQQLQQKLPSMS
jgi:di-N-acetylchitobiase